MSTLLVLTNLPDRAAAERLADELVAKKVAACVNILAPCRSVYRWKGKVESSQEFLLLIKTTRSRSAEVTSRIGELHSYDLPEAIEVSIEGGSAEYLKWIAESVR